MSKLSHRDRLRKLLYAWAEGTSEFERDKWIERLEGYIGTVKEQAVKESRSALLDRVEKEAAAGNLADFITKERERIAGKRGAEFWDTLTVQPGQGGGGSSQSMEERAVEELDERLRRREP